MKLQLPPEGFELGSGERLQAIDIAYETYGELNERRDNAIFVCHALTGDAHVAAHPGTDEPQGWWEELIGPKRGIDTDRYFVICSNILGGCKGTTGPKSINPATGQPYGCDFPMTSVEDAVRAEKLFLDQLGVGELHAVIGGSLGGMRALQWSISFPDFVKRCICVAAGPHLSPQALAFDIIGRQEIESDPAWQDGRYYDDDRGKPHPGLARARQIGHITYLSSASMLEKFGREMRNDAAENRHGASKFSTNFEVESYLNYQGRKFIERFDANSYLYLSRMMDMFDLETAYGSVEQAFAGTTCQYLLVSITSDWLFPEHQQQELLSALLNQRRPASYVSIDSQYGHDAFLIEYDKLGRSVEAFLAGRERAGPPETVNRLDLDRISEMIDAGMHVLDVGSGDGSLLRALAASKQISGVCLDLNFEHVLSCMRSGLPALQLDADTGLELVGDNAFDCVLLNQTIQQLHSALQTVKQILRIAGRGVIGFPNFAYYGYRAKLLMRGQLPVSKTLPYEWYDTPNIHLITIRDFRDLCRRHNIRIDDIEYVADTLIGQLLLAAGLRNLGAERAVVRIGRGHGTPA